MFFPRYYTETTFRLLNQSDKGQKAVNFKKKKKKRRDSEGQTSKVETDKHREARQMYR